MDEVFLEASHLLNVGPLDNSMVVKPLGKRRFGQLQSEKDIQAIKESCVPKKTLQNTEWAESIWREWATHRLEQPLSAENCGFGLDSDITKMSTPAVNHWLQRFVRKVGGKHYSLIAYTKFVVGCKEPLGLQIELMSISLKAVILLHFEMH